MSIATSIPIVVSAEARERISEIGMQHELERMLEYTCQAAIGVHRIEVILVPPCDPGDDLRVVLEVTQDEPEDANDLLWQRWCNWMVETFPSNVLRHFNLLSVYEATDAAYSDPSAFVPTRILRINPGAAIGIQETTFP